MNGYVYIIGNREHGWYKIGKSTRPKIRLNALKILLPFEVDLIALWQTNQHSFLERSLHEQMDEQCINGEWFNLSLENLKSIFEFMLIAERVVPETIPSLDLYLRYACPSASRKKQSKQLGKLLMNRIEEILAEQGIESTPESRRPARKQALAEMKSSRV